MKKVLVGLLALAFVGGSAFAQEWRFSGNVWSGLGTWFTDFQDSDGIYVGQIGNDSDVGHRAELAAEVNNAAGTAGFVFAVEHVGAGTTAGISEAYGWLGFMDNMLTLYAGDIDSDRGGFNSFDRMVGQRMGEGRGLELLVRPMDGLTLGFGGFVNPEGWMAANYSSDNPGTGQPKFTFNVRYEDPETFRLVLGARNTSEARSGFHGWQPSLGGVDFTWNDFLDELIADGEITDRDDPLAALYRPFFDAMMAEFAGRNVRASSAYLSFELLSLEDMHFAASAFFQNLEEFGDEGSMHFYASFGHTGLVDGMDLRLGAGLGMNNLADELMDDYTPFIWVWASVAYELSDSVVPRFDLHYVRAGRPTDRPFNVHHRNVVRNAGASYSEDDSYIRIQPSVQFRVQQNTFFELGVLADIWLGEVDFDNNNQIGAYGLVRVSF